ncbi:MAG: lipid A 3-O-deacylase [Cyclobacteriaceae bacterium]|jgi:lipid A 3-O-deacylase
MIKYCLLCFALTCSLLSKAANSGDSLLYNHQVSVLVDNDVFTSIYRDQYYSSGLFGTYRWIKSLESEKKKYRSITLVQRMFTPMLLSWSEQEEFDRPYAGHISLIGSDEHFHEKYVLINRVEFGWMGPGSLTGTIQENWHESLGLQPPKGWDFEIRNSPIINYYGSFVKPLFHLGGLDLLSESSLAFGTAFNNVKQSLMIRAGKLKPVNSSVQYSGQLGNKKPPLKSEIAEEIIFFYAPSVEYNIYNTTIEGNLLGPTAPHTEQAEDWIIQHRFGVAFSWSGFDFMINYYRRTKETTESVPHRYAGIQLNQRF